MRLLDPARRLPPDAQGRNRYITCPKPGQGKPRVMVGVGIHHPLAGVHGYVEEGRVVMFERGELLPDQWVLYKDGNHLNTDPSNLVAWDRSGHKPTTKPKEPVPCKCGCGQLVPLSKDGRPNRFWLPGHYGINDEFSKLPVSRQRQKQLRNIAHGLCSSCSDPRDGHHRYCPRCLDKWKKRNTSRKEYFRQKYLVNREQILAEQPWRNGDTPRKQVHYQRLYMKYGPKAFWPEGIRRDWNLKYPTRGQKRLLELGIRYDRM